MNDGETAFTPKGFLIVGGAVLVLFGALGFFVLNDSADSFLWLDPAENVAHIAFGLIALAVVFVPGLKDTLAPHLRSIAILLGMTALFFGAYGLLLPGGTPAAPNTFGLANLEMGDNVLHLLLAAWAFSAVFLGPQREMAHR